MPGPRLVAACLAFALIVDGATARAADAPDSEPAPPSIAPAPAPAPGAAPAPTTGLEAGDTAATSAAPMAAPAAAPQVFVDPGAGPFTPRAEPFYRKPWFWGSIAGILLTAAILGTLTLGPSDPPTPQTTLGDMHAF